jgi:gliding motility-associated-like protein
VIPAECKARVDKIEFRIYNRWGAKVYESNDVNLSGWNGDYEGQPAPMETYIYQLKYDLYLEDSDRVLKNIVRKGVVSLIR